MRWDNNRREKELQKIKSMTPKERTAYLAAKHSAEGIAVAESDTIEPTNSDKERESSDKLIEYRRTCQVCGKVWHSLMSREKQLTTRMTRDKLTKVGGAMESVGSCMSCGKVGSGTATTTQAVRNLDANQNEMLRLKSCPECSSANYREEVIEHAK